MTSRTFGLIALSFAILIALSLQLSFLASTPLWMAARDAAHAPLFALIALGWLSLLKPARVAAAITVGALLLLALLAELIEALVYNGISAYDLIGNLLGVLLGFCVWRILRPGVTALGSRLPYYIVIVLIVTGSVITPLAIAMNRAMAQQRWYPVLLEGHMQAARPKISSLGADREVEMAWRNEGLSVHLLDGRIPGIVVTGFVPDWRGYERLVIDVENPASTPFRFEMHIRDRQGTAAWEDRFNFEQLVAPATRVTLRIPLGDIESAPAGRTMDLARVATIAVYSGAESSESFILHRLSLE